MDRHKHKNIRRKETIQARKNLSCKSKTKSSSTPEHISWNERHGIKLRSCGKRWARKMTSPNGNPKLTSRRVCNFTLVKCRSSLNVPSKRSLILENKMENCTGDDQQRKPREKRKLKRKQKIGERDELSRLQGRARYLLIKMKLEQSLIDAYAGDGWKGQSREKIKPEKELQRAGKQIEKCKLGIRDAIRQLDMLGLDGIVKESLVEADGSVSYEHITCLNCKSCERHPDNCIVRCKGTCKRVAHQKCLEPPFIKDEGWLCKFCECKIRVLGVINAHLGTCFDVKSSWKDIFKEDTMDIDNASTFLNSVDWPSEDSEDEDYDPCEGEDSCCSSVPCSSSIQYCSSDEAITCYSRLNGANHFVECHEFDNSMPCVDSHQFCSSEITNNKRQRKDVDYKKLHDEMFGKDLNGNEQSEDEDWGPDRRKRKILEPCDVTAIGDKVPELHPLRELKMGVSCERKPHSRIPASVVEKLREVFSVNELPSRTVKESLSEKLGLDTNKVIRWFRNARYAALKNRKEQSGTRKNLGSDNINEDVGDNSEQKPLPDNVASLEMSYLLPLSSVFQVPKSFRRSSSKANSRHVAAALLSKKCRGAASRVILPADKVQKLKEAHSRDRLPTISAKRTLSKELGLSYREVSAWFRSAVESKDTMRREEKDNAKADGDLLANVKEAEDEQQSYMVEMMERICSLEDKVGMMKYSLKLSICDENNSLLAEEPFVIYVPVVEVREKTSPLLQ